MLTPTTSSRIRASVDRVKTLPGFDTSYWWLTPYLSGAAEQLRLVADGLSSLGAENVGGAESGFLYPKIPVPSEGDAIVEVTERVLRLCDTAAVAIINVDVDTTSNISGSTFQTLIEF